MVELTDNCPMPFGKHNGKSMEDVPAPYLLHLWNENKATFREAPKKLSQAFNQVMAYIEDNLQALELEINKR